jgi:hypothetical protein
MLYAGIGSRKTPAYIQKKMELIAQIMAARGHTLRSGLAIGADQAFGRGCEKNYGNKEIYTVKDAGPEARIMAMRYHPAWGYCKPFVKDLHGRNMLIILGEDLRTPVNLVICWTPEGRITGGTGQALRCAIDHKIKIYNLANKEETEELAAWMMCEFQMLAEEIKI